MIATQMNAGIFKKTFLLAMACALCLSFSLATGQDGAAPPSSDAADKALQERIAKLVDQLGAEKFDEREAAEKELIEIGDDAYDAVREATKSPDPEIAARAWRILPELSKLQIVLVCLDGKGNPIANKAIEVSAMKGDAAYGFEIVSSKSGSTDGEGRFRIGPLVERKLGMKVKVDGYPLFTTGCFNFQRGKHVLRLKFPPPGTVKGAVLIDMKGKDITPVPNAEVRLGDVVTRTDEKGRYVLENVPYGLQIIHANVSYQGGSMGLTGHVLVTSGETAESTLIYSIDERFEIRHHVSSVKASLQTPDGKPLAEMQGLIFWVPPDDAPSWIKRDLRSETSSFFTDKNGGMTVSVPETTKLKGMLMVSGYLPVALGEHEFKIKEVWDIKEPLKLEKGYGIEVTVKDEKGNPVPGALVISQPVEYGARVLQFYGYGQWNTLRPMRSRIVDDLREGESDENWWGMGTTDKNGAAKIEGLPEGKTALLAGCNGYVESECKIVEVTKDGKAKVEITLVECAHVKVTVLDGEAKFPLTDAQVSVRRQPAKKSSDIISVLLESTDFRKDLPPGRQTIIVTRLYYYPAYLTDDFKSGENIQKTISLERIHRGSLKGKIQPAEGAPLSCVNYVAVFPLLPGDVSNESLILRTTSDGRFSLDDVAEGEVLIGARDLDGRFVGSDVVRVEGGKTTDVVLKLQAPGAVEINVSGAGSFGSIPAAMCVVPCDEMKAAAMRYIPALPRTIYWNSYEIPKDGTYRFDGLPPGECYIGLFYAPVHMIALKKVGATVEHGKTVSEKVDLRGAAFVEGQIIGETSEGLDIYLIAEGAENLQRAPYAINLYINIGKEGTFRIGPLPSGKYHLVAGGGYADFEMPGGKTVSGVEIRPTEKVQKFSGKIKNYKYGRHVAEYVYLVGNSVARAAVNPDGAFDGTAPPGKYKAFYVDCFNRFTISGPVDVTVEDGKDLAGIEIP